MESSNTGPFNVAWKSRRDFNANENNVIYEEQYLQQLLALPMAREDSSTSYASCSSNNTTSTFFSFIDSNYQPSPNLDGSYPVSPSTAPDGYNIQDVTATASSQFSISANLYDEENPEDDENPHYENSYDNENPYHEDAIEQDLSRLPLFDIERKGDPLISWWMYYDFHVEKEGAYHVLKPGYLVTEKYPAKRASDLEFENGRLVHKCYVPECRSKPFKRPFDLVRHYKTVHGNGDITFACDYKNCDDKVPFDRKDHCREHYREYHKEDLVKKPQKNAAIWLSEGRNVVQSWWRCSRCLQRNLTKHGWACGGGGCKQHCEKERVEARKKQLEANPVVEKEKKGGTVSAPAPAPPPAAAMDTSGHGYGAICDDGWYEDEEGIWRPCLACDRAFTGAQLPGEMNAAW